MNICIAIHARTSLLVSGTPSLLGAEGDDSLTRTHTTTQKGKTQISDYMYLQHVYNLHTLYLYLRYVSLINRSLYLSLTICPAKHISLYICTSHLLWEVGVGLRVESVYPSIHLSIHLSTYLYLYLSYISLSLSLDLTCCGVWVWG
jgi:hypothetical protein